VIADEVERRCRDAWRTAIGPNLAPGRYDAKWFSAVTGDVVPLPPVDGGQWVAPAPPGAQDWALLLQRRR